MTQEQKLEAVLRGDRVYQKLLEEYCRAEVECNVVLGRLTPEERETLESYISLGEELDHRRTALALEL